MPPRPLFGLVLALAALACTGEEPEVVKDFDLGRFEGRWFEIARVPRDYDRLCHDTTADYRRTGPAALELTHHCRLASPAGKSSDFRAAAVADDPKVPAKLSLELGLYRGDYWVLAVGADYEYALIGHPSRTMLWVLSRKPALPEETYAGLLDVARREGFGVDLLERTPQSSAR
jgi:apolipoprotein D and lipocalin family protein